MSKETHTFSFILLAFTVLISWWVVAAVTHNSVTVTLPAAYAPLQDPVHIAYTSEDGVETYSGEVLVAACDELVADVSARDTDPPRVALSFTTGSAELCDSTSRMALVPFSINFYSANATYKSILDTVTINGAAVTYSVEESAQ